LRLEAARIEVSAADELLTLNLAGGRDTLIYLKPGFNPATYTILNFVVDNVEETVEELASRGVCFERRRLRPGREGHLSRRGRAAHRLVQGSGRKHPLGARGTLTQTKRAHHSKER
jgi:hypothetical protein